jgi:protein-tyrosine-phosphatase
MITLAAVCTFNQTRSVMTAALLRYHAERLGVEARVVGGGTQGRGAAPTSGTIEALARIGIDVRNHRSTPLTAALLDGVHLVLCAEPEHVHAASSLIGHGGEQRCFTLPDFAGLVAAHPRTPGDDVATYVGRLASIRRASDPLLLDGRSIADPTGSGQRAFDATLQRIDAWCRTVIETLR